MKTIVQVAKVGSSDRTSVAREGRGRLREEAESL